MDIPEINLEISKKIQRLSNLYDVEIQVLGREGASKERLDEARIRKEAFAKASKALANYPLPLKDIKPAGIPGVGKSSVEIIKQYLKKGSSDRIDEMEEKLNVFGNKQIWLSIEKIGNWQDRIAYRNLFFLAGGSLDD